ncbi:MAG: hypothetical protein U5K81_09220 [Trueperaceae bacterium]|nr:hypothetical protein [Trueperaceae bacterium]
MVLAAVLLGVATAAPPRPALGANEEGRADAGSHPEGGPWSVRAGGVRVVVPAEGWLPYARELAGTYRRASAVAAAFWDVPAPEVTVVLDAADDVFNAFVDPVTGPSVHVRLRGPMAGGIGMDAVDPSYLLAVHEMVHVVHFASRPGSAPLDTGLVGGSLPFPPPAWLLEGVAVWAESRRVPGGGGRLDDADARGVLRLLAAEGNWPSLDDAALITHDAWPGGQVRYLLGGAFVDLLIRREGLPAFRDAVAAFDAQPPWLGFDAAWRRVTGGDLQAAWSALRAELAAEAEAYPDTAPAAWASGDAPVRAPGGDRLAWRDGAALRVAAWPTEGPEGTLGTEGRYDLSAVPSRPTWWGSGRLAYARLDPRPGGRLRELFALDLTTGAERRLTRGARAFFPAALPGGCLAYVRHDEAHGSAVARWCEGGSGAGTVAWRAPAGVRIAGLAASPRGRVALVRVQNGASTLAELVDPWGAPSLRPLPAPGGALRDPVWDGEDALLVRSDRSGSFESWQVRLNEGTWQRRTATRGGVTGHDAGVVAVRRVDGPQLVPRPEPDPDLPGGGTDRGAPADVPRASALPPDAPDLDVAPSDAEMVTAPYRPTAALRPIGWLPSGPPSGRGFGVTGWATEPTGRLALRGTLGVVPGPGGPLGPAYAALEARLGDAAPVATPARPAPFRARLRLGVLPYAPHLGTPTGPVPRLDASFAPVLQRAPTVRARLEGGMLRLPDGRVRVRAAARLAASSGRVDAWGVPVAGWSTAASVRADPIPAGGTSAGAWLDAAGWHGTALPGRPVASASLRAGWRPPAPAPRGAWGDVAGTIRASLRWTVPVRARWGGARLALERVRLEPGVRLQVAAGDPWRASWGLEALVAADGVVGYLAPASLAVRAGLTGGRAGVGAWASLGLPLLR